MSASTSTRGIPYISIRRGTPCTSPASSAGPHDARASGPRAGLRKPAHMLLDHVELERVHTRFRRRHGVDPNLHRLAGRQVVCQLRARIVASEHPSEPCTPGFASRIEYLPSSSPIVGHSAGPDVADKNAQRQDRARGAPKRRGASMAARVTCGGSGAQCRVRGCAIGTGSPAAETRRRRRAGRRERTPRYSGGCTAAPCAAV